MPPRQVAHLQHCAEPACGAVHPVALSTDYDAPINEHRPKIDKIFDRDGHAIDACFHFFDSCFPRRSQRSQPMGEPLITIIGDSLTDSELKALLAWLLDNTVRDIRTVATS